MPARPSSADVRAGLVAAAARLVATEGPAALTLRRVADEVGTSTMGVYTHFGGMDGLRRAVRLEGLRGLSARLAEVPRTGDPVADLLGLCRAYAEHGLEHPDLYRVMFLEAPLREEDATAGAEGFAPLVEAVAQCIAEGAFAEGDPALLATEIWAAGHGILSLQLAGLLDAERGAEVTEATLGHLVAAFSR
jgi:AcrR family transcriptional regulator